MMDDAVFQVLLLHDCGCRLIDISVADTIPRQDTRENRIQQSQRVRERRLSKGAGMMSCFSHWRESEK
jgi:hypothetical protein